MSAVSAGPDRAAMIPVVALRLIGTFGVSVAGQALPDRDVGSRKARRLLALLAVEGGRFVSIDRIVEALWPGQSPERPADNVATLVSRLRRVLGAEVVRGGRGGYALGTAAVHVDLVEAQRLCAEAQSCLDTAPVLAVAAGGLALNLLLDGALLIDEPAAAWAETARGSARRLLRSARLLVAEAALRTGDPAAAAEVAAVAVAADPFDEAAGRALMRAHHRAGEPAAALELYEHLRNLLATELGSDPAPETRELHLAVLQERDVTAVLPAGRSRPSVGTLAGREPEIAWLTRAWTEAVGGRSALVMVCGEAGIGKTRLAEEAMTLAAATGGEVLRARCYETERSLFLQPVVEALTACIGRLPAWDLRELAGERAPALAALLPEVATAIGTPSADRGPPEVERARTYDAVTIFLRRLSARRPVVLVIDDLHHAGLALLELLHYLRRRASDSRLLVVTTVRTEEGEQALAQLADVASRLDVGPLPAGAVAQLAAAAGQREQADALLQRTGGHTLYVVETLRGWAAGGVTVPRTLAEVVLARVHRAGEPVGRLLRAAAVLDAPFTPAVVARLLEIPTSEGVRHCEDALRSRLVVVTGRAYEFAHDLVREVLYDSTPAPTRFAYHERAAALLADQPEAMAAHAAALGDWPRACRGWLLAAEQALQRFTAVDAEALLDLAIETAGRTGEHEVLGRAYLARGQVHETMARYDAAVADYERAAETARDSDDLRLQVRALRRLGGDAAIAVGRSAQDCIAGLRSGLGLAESLGDRGMQADLLARMAVLLANRLQFRDSISTGGRAVAIARAGDDPRALAKALDGVKTGFAYLGDAAQLQPVLAEVEPLLRRQGDLWRLSWAVFESSFPFIGAAQWQPATARIEAALADNHRSGYVAYERWLTAHLGWLLRLQGRYDDALGHGRRAVAPGPHEGHFWLRSTAAAMLATTLLEMGRTDEAVAVLAELPAGAADSGTEAYRLRFLAALAEATGDAQPLAQADALLHRIDAPPGSAWLLGTDAYLGIARAWLAADRPDRALAAAGPLVAAAERVQWIPALAEGLLILGRCALAQEEREAARDAFARAHTLATFHGMAGVGRAAAAQIDAGR